MKESEILKRIYPSVVTWRGDWEKMLAEVRQFKLTEISLFLTGALARERKKIYQALEKTTVKFIPQVHTRQDMEETELALMVKRYQTQVFTVHFQYLSQFNNSRYRRQIFVENNIGRNQISDLAPIARFGGMCIDLSHLADDKVNQPNNHLIAQKAVQQYRVGCNHLSAVLAAGGSWHRAKNFSELEYVAAIPKKYFSPYICLELINPIKEQLVFRKRLAKLLAKAWNKK